MTTTLQQLDTEINTTRQLANTSLDDIPYATRSGWAGKIQEAKTRLTRLEASYQQQLLQGSVAIFVEGESAQAFGELVEAEGEGFWIDASALYEQLARFVEPTISGIRVWGTGQNLALIAGLKEVMADLGIGEMGVFDVMNDVSLPDHAAVVAHIRRLVRGAAGDTLNRTYLVTNLVRRALKIRYIEKLAPMVVVNAKEDELTGLSAPFARGTARVKINPGEEVDQKFMVKVFKDIQKQISKK